MYPQSAANLFLFMFHNMMLPPNTNNAPFSLFPSFIPVYFYIVLMLLRSSRNMLPGSLVNPSRSWFRLKKIPLMFDDTNHLIFLARILIFGFVFVYRLPLGHACVVLARFFFCYRDLMLHIYPICACTCGWIGNTTMLLRFNMFSCCHHYPFFLFWMNLMLPNRQYSGHHGARPT